MRLLSANEYLGNRRFSVFNEFSKKIKGEANKYVSLSLSRWICFSFYISMALFCAYMYVLLIHRCSGSCICIYVCIVASMDISLVTYMRQLKEVAIICL